MEKASQGGEELQKAVKEKRASFKEGKLTRRRPGTIEKTKRMLTRRRS